MRITGSAVLDRIIIPLSQDDIVWPCTGLDKNNAPVLIVNNNAIIVIADILTSRYLLVPCIDLL